MTSKRPTFDFAPFNDFTRITLRKFRVLQDRFACDVAEIAHDPHDCAAIVRYVNETTEVQVNFSTMRHMPNVSLHAVESHKQRLRNGYGLIWFIRERCPEMEFDDETGVKLNAALRSSETDTGRKSLSRILNRVLSRYASILEENAADFLNGDFAIASQLDRLSQREYRRLQYAASKKQAARRTKRSTNDK